MVGREEIVEGLMLAVSGIAITAGVEILQSYARLAVRMGPRVAPAGDGCVGLPNKILASNRRGRASGIFLESAELSGRLKVIVPTSQFAWQEIRRASCRERV